MNQSRRPSPRIAERLTFDPAAWDGFIWLLAVMCYPRDFRRQREAVGTWEADIMAHARSVAPLVEQMGEQQAISACAALMGMDEETLHFAPWTAAHIRQQSSGGLLDSIGCIAQFARVGKNSGRCTGT